MKKIIFCVCILFTSGSAISQTLTTSKASWIYSGICIERSISNFILLLEMPANEFESQMKLVGADVSYGENFCIVAAEQIAPNTTLDCEHFIFTKCDAGVQIVWYGSRYASGLNKIMELLEPYYLKTIDNVRGYGIAVEDKEYFFSIERTTWDPGMMEKLKIVRKPK